MNFVLSVGNLKQPKLQNVTNVTLINLIQINSQTALISPHDASLRVMGMTSVNQPQKLIISNTALQGKYNMYFKKYSLIWNTGEVFPENVIFKLLGDIN